MSKRPVPLRPQLGPYPVPVIAGRTYLWCACGRSAKQPYCDGSHANSGFEPVRFVPETSMTIFFCGCKDTRVMPLCDNTHARLAEYDGDVR